jgi:hypothetical protein
MVGQNRMTQLLELGLNRRTMLACGDGPRASSDLGPGVSNVGRRILNRCLDPMQKPRACARV